MQSNCENVGGILPLAQELLQYKICVFNNLMAGRWIGWLFPTFIQHVTLELDYFIDKLNGRCYTPTEEICFWNMVNGDHAAFDRHLLDPRHGFLIRLAHRLSLKFARVPRSEGEMFLMLSFRASKQLDLFHRVAKRAPI